MTSRLPHSVVALVAVAFLAYWSLLVYCEIVRPEAPGISLVFQPGTVGVLDALHGGPADRAGLRAGDRIVAIDGHPVLGRLDMMSATANVEIGRPQHLTVDRSGVRSSFDVTPALASWTSWRAQDGPALLTIRVVQLVTLLLGAGVALRRPRDATALVGAVFLATMGVFSVTVPVRFATVWRALPPAASVLLWVPFISTTIIGFWLYAFFAIFPRPRFHSSNAWLLLALPTLPGLGSHALWAYHMIVLGDPGPNLRYWPLLLLTVNAAYVVGGLVRLVRSHRLSVDANQRRRLRVLMGGTLIGSLCGAPVVLSYWQTTTLNLNRSFLESPASAAGTLLFLAMPLSFAYAILRHRLFDVGLMIRQGVRYALARRALFALVPALAVALLLDLLAHGEESVVGLLRSRIWIYGAVVALAVVARSQRQRWLDALDRRFFRERYNAQRILRQVAEDIRLADGITSIAPTIVTRVQQTLHSTFAALLLRDANTGDYRSAGAFPVDVAALAVNGDNRVIGLAVVLGSPVETSGTGNDWLTRKVPGEEIEPLRALGIDLLVPVVTAVGTADAVLALGPKQSEEPYTDDDCELLMAVAQSVALCMTRRERAPRDSRPFEECPSCGTCYDAGTVTCHVEHARLVAAAAPRVIANRYRTERRLGRGGMGTVYASLDTTLGRPVAVKLVRPDLMGVPGAAERFRREARAAAAFAHPNVVTVHDFGIDGTTAFLVMERLDGRTLHEAMLAEGRMPPGAALGILKDVVAAVDAAHRRRLLHRDLKPENIYLDRREGPETAKVLDFGIVKFLEDDDSENGGRATGAALLGTPRYMAPEQLRGERPAVSWDLWALAVIAFEMVTDAHPFASESAMGGLDGLTGLPRPEGLPRSAAAFFARALAVDPADRPTSAPLFLADLEASLLA